MIPGCGAALAFLRVTCGPSATRDGRVFGLPHAPLLTAVREMLPSLDPRRTLVIGDSLTEHVAFARDHGLDALLVKTGSADDTQIRAMQHAMVRISLRGLGGSKKEGSNRRARVGMNEELWFFTLAP